MVELFIINMSDMIELFVINISDILELFVINMLAIPVLFPTAHDRLSLLLKYNAFDVFSIHKCAGHLSLIRPLLQ